MVDNRQHEWHYLSELNEEGQPNFPRTSGLVLISRVLQVESWQQFRDFTLATSAYYDGEGRFMSNGVNVAQWVYAWADLYEAPINDASVVYLREKRVP
jgi:hypothetical protein